MTAPYRAMWRFIRRHWMWMVPILIVIIITILAVVFIDGGSSKETSGNDTWGTLFEYKDGKLDINYGNAFLLAIVVSIALSGLSSGKDD